VPRELRLHRAEPHITSASEWPVRFIASSIGPLICFIAQDVTRLPTVGPAMNSITYAPVSVEPRCLQTAVRKPWRKLG